LARLLPLAASWLILTLLMETSAVSEPEKKADKTRKITSEKLSRTIVFKSVGSDES
jgi:hypothetical protein